MEIVEENQEVELSNRTPLLPSLSHFKTKSEALAFYIGQGLHIDEATKRAGYALLPIRTLNDAKLLQAIDKQTGALLRINIARCRAVLMEFVENTNLPASQRMEAAKTLHSWIGKEDKADKDKNPSEMSGDELRKAMTRLESELGNRVAGASVIDVESEPVSDAMPTQILDILE